MVSWQLRAMFFTVFGYNSPRIERATLDGGNREVVVNDKVVYPVGLALDLANKYIYWIGNIILHNVDKDFIIISNIYHHKRRYLLGCNRES